MKTFGKKHLASIISGGVLLASCAFAAPTNKVERVPNLGFLEQIENEPYLLNVNDCSNKSARYLRSLHSKYHPKIYVIKFKGEKIAHAVVNIQLNGKPFYLDSVFKEYGSNPLEIYKARGYEISEVSVIGPDQLENNKGLYKKKEFKDKTNSWRYRRAVRKSGKRQTN